MKVLYCVDCGDIVAPYPEAMKPRQCFCGRHSVWWRNPLTGQVSVHDRDGFHNRGWILGITNLFLNHPRVSMSNKDIEEIIDQHDSYYLFKGQRSCIVRIRPGMSSDTKWEDLPSGEA